MIGQRERGNCLFWIHDISNPMCNCSALILWSVTILSFPPFIKLLCELYSEKQNNKSSLWILHLVYLLRLMKKLCSLHGLIWFREFMILRIFTVSSFVIFYLHLYCSYLWIRIRFFMLTVFTYCIFYIAYMTYRLYYVIAELSVLL